MYTKNTRQFGLLLAGVLMAMAAGPGAGALTSMAAPDAPSASATLYPGGSVGAGYLETIWGGSGSSRVLAPQTYLFGNGIPAPDLNIQSLQGSGSNSWRATNVSGASVVFTGGALRLYSPASGGTGWHFVGSHNVAACFGGCTGAATGAFVSGATPDVVFQQRLNSGDQTYGQDSLIVSTINQVHLSPQRWASLEIRALASSPWGEARMRWHVGGIFTNTTPVVACPTPSAAYGVAWRLRVNSNGSVDGWVRCAGAATNDWDTYSGAKEESYVGQVPAGTLQPSNGYLVNFNVWGGTTAPTQITLNYIKNQNASVAATTSGEYVSAAIDGGPGAQWTSVTCSGVQTYGAAGNIDVYYRVWNSSAPGWTSLGTCNGNTSLTVPGAPLGRYFQARFVFNAGTTGYRRLGGATVNYTPDTTPPAAFNKTSPTNGAATGTAVTLQWSTSSDSGSGLNRYEYCVDATVNNTCDATWTSTGTSTSAALSGLTPGAREWQVRAVDNAGNITYANAGAWWTFTVYAAPGAFNKTAPANGATGQPTNPTLSWGAASGTVNHYRYCNSTTSGCTPATSVGTNTSVALSGLTAGATYYWQVRACADAGCTVFTNANGGTQWSYTVAAAPGAFSKTSPANGAAGQPTNPTLTWQAASGAVNHYRYCNSTTSGCTPTTSVGTNTSVALSGLTPGTEYSWQVRACADSGCTVFTDANGGAHWSYRTVAAPGSFSKSAPANGATGQPTNPTLTWGASTGVNHYRYCYATTSGCAPNIANGTSPSVALTGLAPGTTYYWQARACADASCAIYTDANGGAYWSFATAAAVGSFNKLAPGNSAINVNTNTAQLQWSAAGGATEYRVCVGTGVNTCNILGGAPGQYASVGAVQFRILSDLGLQPNTTYYWQALATNGTYTTYANGGALAFWSFTTLPSGPASFGKLSPAYNATNVPTSNVSLSWQPASGAVSYTVCVGAFAGDCSYSVTSSGTSAVLAGPLPAGATLVWQVTAHNAGGSTGADNNAWWPMTTAPNAPQDFSKLNPADNATGQPLGVNLTWQDAAGETYYQVCAGTAIGLCNLANVTTTANSTFHALTSLSYGTTYYWQVSACNAGGCTPANSGVGWKFSTLNPPAPGPFQKTTPFNGASGVPADAAQVALAWTAAANADGYEVCFGTQPGTCDLSGNGFQDVGNVTGRLVSQLPFSVTLQPASTYWWQVRAYNMLTATRTFANAGVDFYFTTASASGPGAFSKDAPVNGTFGVPTGSVTLRWFAASGAMSYEVCAGTAVNTCNALPGNAWLNVGSALTTTLANLSPGTTYWWQVRALNGSGATAANGGVWWQFTTVNAEPPAEFSKAAPAHTTIGVPAATAVLSWFVSTGASGYEVCVGSAPGLCETSGGWVSVGTATSYAPMLAAGQTYWWQVRALGGGFSVQANGGQWWAFTTANDTSAGPGDFQKTAPVSGTVVGGNVTLNWTTSSGAVGYRVCVGTMWGLCDVVNNVAISGTNHALSGLVSGAHWWQITAVDAEGDTTQADGGARWVFVVDNTWRAYLPAVFMP